MHCSCNRIASISVLFSHCHVRQFDATNLTKFSQVVPPTNVAYVYALDD
uniref:Uncharacterized protein n=1 Tax=Anguilla anguilla TaxID=7936 RepID=A0A0E9TRW0_ANGAN